VTNIKTTRVVLDANVLVSALVFGGTPRKVTDRIASKTIRPVMSEAILTELRRTINAKFPAHVPGLARYEKLLRLYAIWVPLGSHTITASRDPDDNAILETAVLGKCQFIVSGDKDLLDLRTFSDINILTPADFLDTLVE
jgi:putative PIN family toxin of toxin-antitoxin system